MGCVMDYIAGIADFIKNSFVILSVGAFCAYVYRRGPVVCWHKFVNAGILGKDQRHQVKVGFLDDKLMGHDAISNAIDDKKWVTASIDTEGGLVIVDGIKMFILGRRTVLKKPGTVDGEYLDILTDREIRKEKFRGERSLRVSIFGYDGVAFIVADFEDRNWQFIRTPSLIAKLFGEEPKP